VRLHCRESVVGATALLDPISSDRRIDLAARTQDAGRLARVESFGESPAPPPPRQFGTLKSRPSLPGRTLLRLRAAKAMSAHEAGPALHQYELLPTALLAQQLEEERSLDGELKRVRREIAAAKRLGAPNVEGPAQLSLCSSGRLGARAAHQRTRKCPTGSASSITGTQSAARCRLGTSQRGRG
jgi:hypothetical protein